MSKTFLRDAVSGAEGEGAEVRRLFPVKGLMNFDPFVLWDDFTVPPSAGFPDHPHRGFEGVTYVFEGTMQHTDNLENSSTVRPGGLQRFTAGRGIVHSEMPSQEAATRGIQLWVNLSLALKQVSPDYQQIDADDVPVQVLSGGIIRELVGENSPLQLRTPVRYRDVQLDAGRSLTEVMPENFRGFVYMVEGNAELNGQTVEAGQALFYDGEHSVNARANAASRFMLCFGQPHDEPVYQHGPYVD